MKALVGRNRIDGPTTFVSKKEELGCLSENRSCWWCPNIFISAIPHDQRAGAQKGCREKIGEPKTDIFLGVDLWKLDSG